MLFYNRQRSVRFKSHDIAIFLRRVASEAGIGDDDFSVTLVSDRVIQRLNARFRQSNRPTDVLSFPAFEEELNHELFAAERPPRLGEVVISAQTAQRQARRLRHSLEQEIKLLIIHGILHLMGYDHETDHGEMTQKEYWLRSKVL